jgi:hypothetical protein
MPMSQLVKPSLLFRSTCVQLNPYGHRHHCGIQISSYTHDKSILLLGHLDACNIDRRKCILTSLNLSINQSSSQLLFKQVTSNLSMVLLSYLIHLNKGLTNCWTNFFTTESPEVVGSTPIQSIFINLSDYGIKSHACSRKLSDKTSAHYIFSKT